MTSYRPTFFILIILWEGWGATIAAAQISPSVEILQVPPSLGNLGWGKAPAGRGRTPFTPPLHFAPGGTPWPAPAQPWHLTHGIWVVLQGQHITTRFRRVALRPPALLTLYSVCHPALGRGRGGLVPAPRSRLAVGLPTSSRKKAGGVQQEVCSWGELRNRVNDRKHAAPAVDEYLSGRCPPEPVVEVEMLRRQQMLAAELWINQK